MGDKILQKVVLVSILILPFLLYFFWVYAQEESFFTTLEYVGPRTWVEKEIDGELKADTSYYTIPDFNFSSQADSLVSSQELRNNILLVNFFFSTCPSICPAMNFKVQQVQNRFKGYEHFKIVSFSVDPKYDTPEILREYAKRYEAIDGRWHFLTGEEEEIYKVAQGFFANAMRDSLADGGFLHSQNLILVDWDGHIRSGRDDSGNIKAVYDGLQDVEVNALKDDIKVLIAEFEKKKSIDEYQNEKEAKKKSGKK